MTNKKKTSKKETLRANQAYQQRTFLECPIEKNTILFIDNTSCAASGDLQELLAYCFSRPEYSNYTFFWTTESIEAARALPEEALKSGRLRLLASEAYNYRKSLATVEIIITTQMLPHYYVKRAGQTLVYLPSEYIYRNKLVSGRSFIRSATPQLNAADVVVSPHTCILDALSSLRSPACVNPAVLLNCDYPFAEERQISRKLPRVIVALKNSTFNKMWFEKPDAFFNWSNELVKRLCIEPEELAVFIPGNALEWLYDGYVSSSVSLIQNAEGLRRYLPEANIVITDNSNDMCISRAAGVDCIMVVSGAEAQRVNDPAIYPFFPPNCIIASSLSEAIELAVDGVHKVIEERPSLQQNQSCQVIMGSICERRGQPKCEDSQVGSNGEFDLICLRWPDEKEFHEFVKHSLKGYPGTILLMADKGSVLLPEDLEVFSNARITYRTGYHLGTAAERSLMAEDFDAIKRLLSASPENFISMEWRRVLGDVWFNTIYAPEEVDGFWSLMFSFAPANEVVFYSSLSDLEQKRTW